MTPATSAIAAAAASPAYAEEPFSAPHPPPRFDGIARLYRWAEYLALGPLLKRTRETFLPALADRRRALLLGDGDGRFAAALLRVAPALHAHAVDGSLAMLGLLASRCRKDGNADRLRVQHTSVLSAAIPAATDLIVTHFLLDCLTQPELDSLASRLAAAVQPGCLWVISEFGYPRHRLARAFARIYLRLLYLAFRVLTGLLPQRLPDPERALLGAGFRRLGRRERLGGFLYAELWQRSLCTAANLDNAPDATSPRVRTSTHG